MLAMATGQGTTQVNELDEEPAEDTPSVTLCESRPGKSVLLEAGNTDGWIASDTTLESTR
jgi:hypothetical protein